MINQTDTDGAYSATFAFRTGRGVVEPLHFSNPIQVISTNDLSSVISALDAVERAVNAGNYAAGYVAYEAAPAFDSAFCVQPNCAVPLLWFGIYDAPSVPPTSDQQSSYDVSEWKCTISPEQYSNDIKQIRQEIAIGNSYQVNYTMRLSAQFDGNDSAFFQRLRESQNSDYCAYLNLGRFRLLSASPELFFHRIGNQIMTRPMKGTVARGRSSDEDVALKEWLRTSEKDKAENVMIVDLLRNDLGRLAEIGSVHVEDMFQIETYPTVHQMTSKVSATLRDKTSLVDLFRALFPCGSITGAPKISTMRIITDLEDAPRQAYCGAIGYITPYQETIFSVAIRTVTIDTKTGIAEYGTGGGITWDSDAETEYTEAITKAAILYERWPEFDLLETFALRDGKYVLLERHLDRVMASAEYFSVSLDRRDLLERLYAYAKNCKDAYRVRLLVSKNGKIKIEGQPLGETRVPVHIALAKQSINSSDKFLFHKTTHRSVYQVHRNEQPAPFDILLWNERDEITEFTTGNVIVELDGDQWTPPITCGLLPGTLRAEMLDAGIIRERIITRSDLQRGTQIWFINSVRGRLPVTLLD